jgi:hypothetical protein
MRMGGSGALADSRNDKENRRVARMRRLEVMPAAAPDFVCVWLLAIFAVQSLPAFSRGAGKLSAASPDHDAAQPVPHLFRAEDSEGAAALAGALVCRRGIKPVSCRLPDYLA